MKKLTNKMSSEARQRFCEVAAQIVQLYEATGQTDNVEKWRKELETAKQLEVDAKK